MDDSYALLIMGYSLLWDLMLNGTLFITAYARLKLKWPKNRSTLKHIFIIIGLYIIVRLIMIPINMLILSSTPNELEYITDFKMSYLLNSLISCVYSIISFIIFYYISKFVLGIYKNNIGQNTKFTPEEKSKKEAAIREYNRKRHEEMTGNSENTLKMCNTGDNFNENH